MKRNVGMEFLDGLFSFEKIGQAEEAPEIVGIPEQMTEEDDIIENEELRDKLITRTEVLDKAKKRM